VIGFMDVGRMLNAQSSKYDIENANSVQFVAGEDAQNQTET
jgi:hypothetical protein